MKKVFKLTAKAKKEIEKIQGIDDLIKRNREGIVSIDNETYVPSEKETSISTVLANARDKRIWELYSRLDGYEFESKEVRDNIEKLLKTMNLKNGVCPMAENANVDKNVQSFIRERSRFANKDCEGICCDMWKCQDCWQDLISSLNSNEIASLISDAMNKSR